MASKTSEWDEAPRASYPPGADHALSSDSQPAQVLHLRKRDTTATGLDAVVDLSRQIRAAVRDAIAEGQCPVILAGNCNACLGTLAGSNPRASA